MKFQIVENLKEDFAESEKLSNYNTKLYINGIPVKMIITSEDLAIWKMGAGAPEYHHDRYGIKLISTIDSDMEELEYFNSLSSAIIRFNDLKEQYGKQVL